MNQAVPSTTSRAVAVNTSGLRVRAMILNTLRSTGRPHRITTASAPRATAASSQRRVSFFAPPSSGMAASSGIAIRSWNSRMAKPSRPWSLLIALCSDSSCRPTAVDDSASATPTTSALFHWKWSSSSRPPSTSPDIATCAAPAPNTERRITFRRAGDSPGRSRTAASPRRSRPRRGCGRRPARSPARPGPAPRRPPGSPAPRRSRTLEHRHGNDRRQQQHQASSRPPLCMGIPGHREARSASVRVGKAWRAPPGHYARRLVYAREQPAGRRPAQGCRVDLHGPRVQTARRWRRVRRHTHPGVPNPCPATVEVDLVRRQRWPPPDIGTVCLRWRCARSHPTRQNR